MYKCAPYVYFQIARCGKSRTAEITFVRLFFSVMHAAVIDQLTLLRKARVAGRAGEGLLT